MKYIFHLISRLSHFGWYCEPRLDPDVTLVPIDPPHRNDHILIKDLQFKHVVSEILKKKNNEENSAIDPRSEPERNTYIYFIQEFWYSGILAETRECHQNSILTHHNYRGSRSASGYLSGVWLLSPNRGAF